MTMNKNILKEADTVLKELPENSSITVGLSGGADSVCLLMLLCELSAEYGYTLSAVHVNHCLRGAESDRDEQFCRSLCERLNVPLAVSRVDVKCHSEKTGKSTEAAARELRYEALERAADGGFIATAHNLNDNAETVIFNMTRGTGLKGLCGIPKRRGNIIRPLLGVSRAEIEEYLDEKGQTYVTDSTNLTDDYSRNKIRHSVIPVLCGINRAFLDNIKNMTEILSEQDKFCEEASGAADKDAAELSDAPRKRYVQRRLEKQGFDPDSSMICRADKVLTAGGREQIKGNVFAVKRNGVLEFDVINSCDELENFSAELKEGVNFFPDGKKIILEAYKSQDINKSVTNYLLDCGRIKGSLVMRTRREGDRIMLKGESFHRKLRKLYNSMKIPSHRRDSAVIIQDENGIVFAQHCGVSASAACDENSTDIVSITIIDE